MDDQKKIKSPFKRDGMFNEANPLMFELAMSLRKNMTIAETVLWNYLKAGYDGLKFRRQHPLGIYIADFYCHKIKLIIEVDGNIHTKKEIKEYDIQRQSSLASEGYTILRFTNEQVLKEINFVLSTIKAQIQLIISKI